MKLYKGKRVKHKQSKRQGEVVQWYTEGPKAGKMWILFDDGEVELRWVHVFRDVRTTVDDGMDVES